MFSKQNIRKSEKVYAYLQNGDFRFKDAGTQRITVKDADFSGTHFNGGGWEYFDFVNCDFYGLILMDWIGDCTFTDCRFRGMLGFGDVENCRFLRCKVEPAYIGFDGESVGLIFENCEFYNPDGNPNHRKAVISAGEMALIGCEGKNFTWGGHKKLTLRHCSTQTVRLGTALIGLYRDKTKMPYSDFLIEDCDLTGCVDTMNANLNNLTMRRCKLRNFGIGTTVKGNTLVEDIKGGLMWLGCDGKLTLRNCVFMGIEGQPNSLEVSGDVPTHTLIENVTCGRKPVDVIRQSTPIEKWDDPPRNKSLIIRNCKIPHLQANWAQTEHLRIENCEFDSLHIEDGRIGKLEIIGCTLSRLNVSRTQVKEQNVGIYEGSKYSGHITTTDGSNIKLVPRD